MASHDWTDEAAGTSARPSGRREAGGASATTPGSPEQADRVARREADGSAPARGTGAEDAPAAAAGEPPDSPALFGEDPGDIGQ